MSAWLLPISAAAMWAGIASAARLEGVPWWVAFILGLIALSSGVISAPTGRRGIDALAQAGLTPRSAPALEAVSSRPPPPARLSPWVTTSLVAIGLFLVGAGWGSMRIDGVRGGVLAREAPGHVEVLGSLRTDPKPGPFGWTAMLGVSEARIGEARTSLRESVWLEGEGSMPEARRGDRVSVSGTILIPGDPGFGSYLMSRGVAVELRADSFRRVGPSSDPIVRLAGAARAALGRSLQSYFAPRESGLLMGLALGDTSGLDEGMARDFKATGLSHLLAVSGENVAMVLAPMMALTLMLRLAPGPRFALGTVTVIFFVILTGGEPSVLRAGVMAGIALTGTLLGRPRSSASVLGGAILILLLLDPFLVSSIGFQLSVGATAGMVAIASPLAAKMTFLPKPLAVTLATSLAAQLGVGPLLLFYFHWVPGVTLAANLLSFPAVGPALVLGLAAAAAGLIFHPLGWILAKAAMVPMGYLEWLADRLATAPVPSITSRGGVAPLLIGTGLMLALAAWVRTGWRPPRALIVVAIASVPVFAWSTALRAGPPDDLTVHFFDVGQGDGALITSPGGAEVLVDGGPDPELTATKLASLGVKRLDAVIATHPHADHVAGFPEVFARFPVGVVLDPGCDEPSPSYDDFLAAVREEDLPVRNPRAGETIQVGDLALQVISPTECYSGSHSDPNNDSIVFRLDYRGDSILFTGDAEVEAQQVMLDSGVPLSAEVLKVPHHGGSTSLPEFFDAVHPQLAIVSVGQPNDYGHPVPAVLDEIAATGASIARTDESGDVTVTFSGQGVLVESAAA